MLGFCCLIVSILSIGTLVFFIKRVDASIGSDYRSSLLALLAYVVNADGAKRESELNKVKDIIDRYYNSKEERDIAFNEFLSYLESGTISDLKLGRFCSKVKVSLNNAAKSEILMELLSVAYADDNFEKDEDEQIKTIANSLGFDEARYNSIKTIFKKKYNAGFYDCKTKNLHSRFCILVMLAKLIKTNGYVTYSKMEKAKIVISQYFLTENDQKLALNQLQSIIDSKYDYDFDNICDGIKSSLKANGIWDLIKHLFAVVYDNDGYESIEKSIIAEFAEKVGVTKKQYDLLLEQFFLYVQRKEEEKRAKYGFHEDPQDKSSDDGNKKKSSKYRSRYEKLDTNFCILVLLAKVMDADHHHMKCELDEVKTIIRKYFTTEDKQKAALKQLQSILNSPGSKYKLDDSCIILADRLDVASKEQLIMELLTIVYADENFGIAEGKKLQKIADCLNIPREEYAKIKNRFKKKYQETHNKKQEENKRDEKRQNDGGENRKNSYNSGRKESNSNSSGNLSISDAYSILGVADSVPDSEVKKAYRAMAMKYHPDNVSTYGDEAVRQATETMKNINLAWELVKMARNLK